MVRRTTSSRPDDGIRALLTKAEIRAVNGDITDASQKSTYLHRVRQRIDMLRYDVDLLQEHRPEEYAQLRAVVCQGRGTDRDQEGIAELERRVELLESQLEGDGQ